MKSIIKQSILYKLLGLFYGELFNKNNPIKTRIMRLVCRTPFKKVCYFLYKKIFQRNNKKIVETNNLNLFDGFIEENKILLDLKNKGISLNINLTKIVVDNIVEKIVDKSFQVNRDQNRLIKLSEKKNDDVYLYRLHNPHNFVSEIDDLSRNIKILSVVRNYFGTEPIINSSQIWWTFPFFDKYGNNANPPGNEYGYHYDVDDFKFLKLFFYLTDVDENNGPHIYIKNNGKKTFKEYLNRRIDNKYAENFYKDRIVKIVGAKGCGFIEDTSFYHRGSNPLSNSGRCVLQIIYSLGKW